MNALHAHTEPSRPASSPWPSGLRTSLAAPVAARVRPTPDNHLLLNLPESERDRLSPELEPLSLQDGQVLCEAGARQTHVYFPADATLSLMSFTSAGETCELMAIGREGLAGADVVLGAEHSLHRLVVQRGGQAWRLRTPALRAALPDSPALRARLLSLLQLQLLQLGQSVVCHSHHSITERLCLWLLLNSSGNTPVSIAMTHEAIASLLGVRRESITQAAGRLQAMGLLSTRRGQITLHHREGLRDHACECHSRLEAARQRLLSRCDEDETAHAGRWWGSDQGVSVGLAALADVDDGHDSLYRDLYEFAPVGFVTLDTQRRILQTNLAAAIFLGVANSQLQRKVFTELLASESRDAFTRFHREVLNGHCRRHCDVSLNDRGRGAPSRLRIQASTDEDGQECRMVMMDLDEGAASQDGMPALLQQAAALHAAQAPQPDVLRVSIDDDLPGAAGSTRTPGPGRGAGPASWISGLAH
jgi:PAS domain S-box-containing protein